MSKINFPIHVHLNELQLEKGLRYSDYQAYRRFLSKKLRKLRKMYHLTHMNKNKKQRTNFEYSQVGMEQIRENPETFKIPLFESERCWCFGNQLKQEFNDLKEENNRLRHRYVAKFRKAALVHSKNLYDLSVEHKDEFSDLTLIEIEVYHRFLCGIFYLEKRKFSQSKKEFEICEKIYSTLSNSEGERFSTREMHARKVSKIKDYLKVCDIMIEEEGEGEEEEEEQQQQPTAGTTSVGLEFRLRNLLEGQKHDTSNIVSKVCFLDEEISIESSDRVRDMYSSSLSLLKEIEAQKRLTNVSNIQNVLSLYDKVLTLYRDMLINVRDDIRKYQKYKRSSIVKQLKLFHTFIDYQVLLNTIQRNEVLVIQYEMNLKKKMSKLGTNYDETEKLRQRMKLNEDIVRIYETILQYLEDIQELEGVGTHPSIELLLKAKSFRYRFLKCFYQSRCYSSKERQKEAFALLIQCEKIIQKSEEEVFNKIKELKDQTLQKQVQEEYKKMKAFQKEYVDRERGIITANFFINENETTQLDSTTGGGGFGKKKRKVGNIALLDDLNSYVESKKKNPLLIHFPPSFAPIAPKPLFFDIAQDFCKKYPKLEGKVKEEKKGWFGGWFG